ncbi:LOW QUALITY PROTEIN: peroxisome assembly protein 12-like [Uloborus diversus]|uniref:LOW QUALITY PROTEIN: peroxisome assembly protein 12-like n=1 Tax=Uloborus diversus TaxID=327109 RepID=UPI0024096D64|nr:LOW QUALITY PROTEIN: peroxisome assembly protein 12-like [Uloborus diversus]
MAELGIHHAIVGETKPTIFEILGQENLVSGLRSAFRHVFKILAENYPEKFSLLYSNFDEGYTIVDSIFQYIHLRLKGGLFTETFYSLKRLPDPRTPDVSKKKVFAWVFLSVVLPYIQSQLEELFKNIRRKQAENQLHYSDLKKQLALIYLKVYPIYHFVWEMTVLSYYMLYALGKSDYHSPVLHLTRTKLIPLSMLDYSSDAWKDYFPLEEKRKLSTVLWSYMNGLVGGVTMTISVGAFLTQFLDWWYTREGKLTSFAPMPVPPPPPQWPSEIPADICFICKKKRTNDTALASSGFVFCYPCVFRYVQAENKCPVTGYYSSLNQLIKLYHQEQ